jgi:hypothetical protein
VTFCCGWLGLLRGSGLASALQQQALDQINVKEQGLTGPEMWNPTSLGLGAQPGGRDADPAGGLSQREKR